MKSPLIAGLSILLAACGSEEAPDSTKPPVTVTPPIITTPEPDTEPQDRGELIIGVERCEYEDGSLGNCPPVAQAGPDIEVNNDAASVHLHRLATDIDNLDSQLVYTWEQLSGTPVIIRTSNSINYFQIPELQFTSQVLVFRQTVSDGESLDTDEVRYTLPPLIKTIRDDGLYETDIGCFSLEGVKVNCPPIADAGEDILVEYDQISVSIYGTSTDADRTYPDTTWSQISGPDVELVYVSTNRISFDVPEKTDESQIITLEFTATDNERASNLDTVNITIPARTPISFTMNALNDTGLTHGLNYPSGQNFDCTGYIANYQDCYHGRDATHNDSSDGAHGFSFTKIGMHGDVLAADADGWSCIRDNVTGLVWEYKRDGTTRAPGTLYLRDNVDYHLDRLNSTELCGINDWRLPSLQDAISIFHYSQPDPSSLSYFDEDYFNGGMYPFWILEGDKYFNVNGNGYVNTYPGDKWMVLGVHKPGVNNSKLGPVSYYRNDFIVDEKTAKDSRTGLEWTRCSNQQLVTNGVCVSINETYSWKDTIELVETLNATTGFAGYFDWRLPNTKELYTILTGSSTKWSIRINSDVFPLTSTDGAIPTSTFSTSLIYLKLPYGEHKFTGRDSSVLTDIMLVRDY